MLQIKYLSGKGLNCKCVAEAPEQPVDNRCLYDKLEEQRLKKQEEFEEKVAFRMYGRGNGNSRISMTMVLIKT